MQIRPFEGSDRDSVVQLWINCNLVVPWNNPLVDIERKMEVDPDLFLIGLINGELMATIMGGYEGHRGWVNYLAVEPRYQGHHYGKQLMEEIERRLLERGCPKVQLQVRATNSEVIKFYKAIGYKEDKVVCFGKRLIDDQAFDTKN